MMRVKKAIIPAAGLGTRFLPVTKAMPKEMLPIVDKPTIQYIIEEAIESGIEDIIIVTGKGKRAIEDHFDNNFELEDNLLKKNKHDLLKKINYSSSVDIHYIRQKEPKGLGHAIWCARKFIGNEPFAVLLGDDIVEADPPCLEQLINVYDETYNSVVGVQEVPIEDTHRYGIVDVKNENARVSRILNMIEKPTKGTAPSNKAIMGRYIFTPKIFNYLEKHKIGAGGEIQLTDAIQELSKEEPVYSLEYSGNRYDVGEIEGFIKTNIEFALKNQSINQKILKDIKEIVKRYSK